MRKGYRHAWGPVHSAPKFAQSSERVQINQTWPPDQGLQQCIPTKSEVAAREPLRFSCNAAVSVGAIFRQRERTSRGRKRLIDPHGPAARNRSRCQPVSDRACPPTIRNDDVLEQSNSGGACYFNGSLPFCWDAKIGAPRDLITAGGHDGTVLQNHQHLFRLQMRSFKAPLGGCAAKE